jgi:hypothetical protein
VTACLGQSLYKRYDPLRNRPLQGESTSSESELPLSVCLLCCCVCLRHRWAMGSRGPDLSLPTRGWSLM